MWKEKENKRREELKLPSLEEEAQLKVEKEEKPEKGSSQSVFTCCGVASMVGAAIGNPKSSVFFDK